MAKQFPEWLENFAASQLTEENALSATAADETAKEGDGQEMAHVTEEEQESRMKSVDEGYNVDTNNPDDKHFEDGDSASERAFEQANKRDMTTPEGRYAFDEAGLEKLANDVTNEILTEITSNALNPAEEMLNREVPLAQLASIVKEVEATLHQHGIRRASFRSTMERVAEVINLNIPLEVSVGNPTSADSAPAADAGLGMADTGAEPMGDETANEGFGDDMLAEADDMMMPTAKKQNRFIKY